MPKSPQKVRAVLVSHSCRLVFPGVQGGKKSELEYLELRLLISSQGRDATFAAISVCMLPLIYKPSHETPRICFVPHAYSMEFRLMVRQYQSLTRPVRGDCSTY